MNDKTLINYKDILNYTLNYIKKYSNIYPKFELNQNLINANISRDIIDKAWDMYLNRIPPEPYFFVKIPRIMNKKIEKEIESIPVQEFLVNCPYCNYNQMFDYNQIKYNPIEDEDWFIVKCQNCKNKISINLNNENTNKNNFELDYEIYLDELTKFSKSETNFIVKNYILFCFEEFGENFNLNFLSKYFKEELSKNLPESFLKIQLDLIKKKHKEVKKKYTMAEIDSMDGIVFEGLIKELFDKIGYINVRVTSKSRDGGVDVVAYKDGLKYIIQTKRYQASKTLSNKAVQEIISGEKTHNADKLMVITTAGKFSIDAKRVAEINSVELVDRIKLKKLLMEANLI